MKGLILRFTLLWSLTVITGFAALLGESKAAWYLFGCVAFLTLFGSLGSILVVGEIGLTRQLSTFKLRHGDSLMVEGVATIPFRFPLAFAVIMDEWKHEQSGRLVRGAALLLPFGRTELTFTYMIPNLRRGVYKLHSTESMAADFLHLSGFRKKREKETVSDEVHVFPVPLKEASSGGTDRRPIRESFESLGGIRDYADGDSVRRIDWKSYLRRGRLMTKLPDADDGLRTVLILDSGLDEEQFERAVGAAAGYIEREPKMVNSEVGLVCGDQTYIERIDQSDHKAIMRFLTVIQRQTDIQLKELLREASKLAGVEGECIVITGRLDGRILHNIEGNKGSAAISVLYASAKPVLSTPERSLVSELQRMGCDFGFVPNRTLRTEREGVPVYG